MKIRSLSLRNFRNLKEVDLEFVEGINVFVGLNGSGKTSLLEALNVISTGRSFRTSATKKIVSYEEDSFVLFTTLARNKGGQRSQLDISANSEYRLGIEKGRDGSSDVKLNGQKSKSISAITKLLPIQILAPDVENVLTGDRETKRSFMDWGVFHVEHSFFNVWKESKQIIKIRNSVLRGFKQGEARADYKLIEPWDIQISELEKELNSKRCSYIEAYNESLEEIADLYFEAAPPFKLSLDYRPGWNREAYDSYKECLAENFQSDTELGYTKLGPHRSYVEVFLDGGITRDTLSRGQEREIIFLLKLAQSTHLKKSSEKTVLFLIDDIQAELDSKKIEFILSVLKKLDSQILITCLEDITENAQFGLKKNEIKLFHVEHGTIREAV